jgi:hypothetical protein
MLTILPLYGQDGPSDAMSVDALPRRIGAMVGTGSVVRNSRITLLHRWGFSTSSP